jgi:hypothetical protein
MSRKKQTHTTTTATPTPAYNLNDPALIARVEKYIAWWSQFPPDEKTGCSISNLKSSDPRGYTLRRCPITQKQDYVHRIAFRVFVADIPEDKVVRHRCHSPRCMSYLHLQLGTQKENMADKMAAGRHRTSSKRRKRLTPDTIIAIKHDLASGMSGYAVARKYGIGEMTVSNIRTGKSFKSVIADGFSPSKRRPGRPPKKPSTSVSLGRGRATA